MKKNTLLLLLSLFTAFACKDKKDDTVDPQYAVGKNRFTVVVDGAEREYYVHVPAGYSESNATPVVFMLHGTSGDGEKFYDISGWKEVGETENILTVFPSSGRYCIIDADGMSNTTKWNTPPDAEFVFCAGETPLDDIKFLRTVITELNGKFNVDNKRIYLCGFSNGGQMAAKCAVEMSDVLAAVCESAGSFSLDTTYIPRRKIPVLQQRGNEDYGPGNEGPAIPLSEFDTLLSTPDFGIDFYDRFYRVAQTHINTFMLDPDFTITGDTNTVVVATYRPLDGSTDYEFKYALIKGMAHVYPNGTNHWLHGAEVNWEWMKAYQIP